MEFFGSGALGLLKSALTKLKLRPFEAVVRDQAARTVHAELTAAQAASLSELRATDTARPKVMERVRAKAKGRALNTHDGDTLIMGYGEGEQVAAEAKRPTQTIVKDDEGFPDTIPGHLLEAQAQVAKDLDAKAERLMAIGEGKKVVPVPAQAPKPVSHAGGIPGAPVLAETREVESAGFAPTLRMPLMEASAPAPQVTGTKHLDDDPILRAMQTAEGQAQFERSTRF